VFWIGGGSGGGKTTIAGGLARRHHLRHVSTDDAMPDHASRLSATEAPQLDAFRAMSMDERWVTRSPREMLQTFHWFRGEGFDLIVEDLLSLPTSPRSHRRWVPTPPSPGRTPACGPVARSVAVADA
jgi:hypothetical protein